MTTYPTLGHALADPESNIAQFVAKGDARAAKREEIISAWMATGLTREEAWLKAIGR